MDDPIERTSTSNPSAEPGLEVANELAAAIARFSRPEFRAEITRLYGIAKDHAIEQRDRMRVKSQIEPKQ
jgi:hypothetical protein